MSKKLDDQRLELVCLNSKTMFYEYNPKTTYSKFTNAENVLGFKKEEMADMYEKEGIDYLINLIHPDDVDVFNRAIHQSETFQIEVRILCSDGKYHSFALNHNNVKNGDDDLTIGCLKNIDDKYQNLNKIQNALAKDEMTGLLNRASTFYIIDKLKEDTLRDSISAFIFIDIDNFKQINDKYGHLFGDEIIIYVADVLKRFIGNDGVVGRFGGDEFIVFIPNVSSKEVVAGTVEKIISEIKNYKNSISEQFALTISVGLTFEKSSEISKIMLEHADKALYTAKLLGKGQLAIYNKENILNPLDSNIANLSEKQEFFKAVDQRLLDSKDQYLIASIAVENHTLFNKWYGPQKGQEYLDYLIRLFIKLESDYKGIFGCFSNNEFALLLPKNEKVIKELVIGCKKIASDIGNTVVFLPAIGLYYIEDITISSNLMYLKAVEARKSVYNNFNNRVKVYSNEESNILEKEIMLILKFKKALENDELKVFLQPKIDIISNKIVGAEALVRWHQADGTVVRPDEFIPILEKYAILYQADFYCWEKLFKTLHQWQTEDKMKITPVSINVSRSDILTIDVVERLKKLTNKYNIDRNLIRIEITESLYTESKDMKAIEDTIGKLHKLGFLIFMDDFGSGYSSLSVLKDLNFDVLKMDMKFLAPSPNQEKGFHILESVVKLAHDIGLPVVVEGVETKKQVEYLKNINCRFAQGYYYYQPMPMDEYKKIISNSNKVEANGIIGYWRKHGNSKIV